MTSKDKDTVARLDRIVDETAARYDAMRKKLFETVGDRPFGSETQTHTQKMERFASVWEDVPFWTQALADAWNAVPPGLQAALGGSVGGGPPAGFYPKDLMLEARDLAAKHLEAQGKVQGQ